MLLAVGGAHRERGAIVLIAASCYTNEMDPESDKKAREHARAYLDHGRDRLASQAAQRKELSDKAFKTIGYSSTMGGVGLTLFRLFESGLVEFVLFVGLAVVFMYSVHQAFQIVLPHRWDLSAGLDELADSVDDESIDVVLSLADSHRRAAENNAVEIKKFSEIFICVVKGLYVQFGFLAALILSLPTPNPF